MNEVHESITRVREAILRISDAMNRPYGAMNRIREAIIPVHPVQIASGGGPRIVSVQRVREASPKGRA